MRYLELRARSYVAFLRDNVAEEQSDQRRLAAAIRAHDADAIATQDGRREAAHD